MADKHTLIKCEKCGNTIVADKPECPFCKHKHKVRKPLYKRWWFWVIAVFVTITVLSNLGGDKDEEQTESIISESSFSESSSPDSSSDPKGGASKEESSSESSEEESEIESTSESDNANMERKQKESKEKDYVLNTDSMIFHEHGCQHEKRLKNNRKEVHDTRESIISQGYTPCEHCEP